ncbi:hypothetical protein [Spirosoma endophyticum]|uniref:Uncharacterized protein n=1 Tax=Spirosoma endophyticum TaxID=662367 RepID=A0A1I1U8K8_9BACT|nr:hypothetical protein [Spirosoma endophyticum]SFD67162.1 hypothetical protein SAMN05216167_106169 [Spirosoma endophyticum]
MEMIEKQVVKKELNGMGNLYEVAPESKKMAFREALLVFSKRDSINYYRAFRDVWKYSESITKAPFAIVATAHNVLGFNYLNETDK